MLYVFLGLVVILVILVGWSIFDKSRNANNDNEPKAERKMEYFEDPEDRKIPEQHEGEPKADTQNTGTRSALDFLKQTNRPK